MMGCLAIPLPRGKVGSNRGIEEGNHNSPDRKPWAARVRAKEFCFGGSHARGQPAQQRSRVARAWRFMQGSSSIKGIRGGSTPVTVEGAKMEAMWARERVTRKTQGKRRLGRR